jgi:serine/threonine protein kinase
MQYVEMGDHTGAWSWNMASTKPVQMQAHSNGQKQVQQSSNPSSVAITATADTGTDNDTGATACFDPHSGFPVNNAATRIIRQNWTDTAEKDDFPVQLDYAVLKHATGNFSPNCKIGGGGSCIVFSAVVYGVEVAVKALTQKGQQEKQQSTRKQFAAEMNLLQNVRHPQICRLLGVSTNRLQRCIVLELCAGGALDKRLKIDGSRSPGSPGSPDSPDAAASFSCRQRVEIAVAVARALVHLHSQKPPLIHRDVKSANVLLSCRTEQPHILRGMDMLPRTKVADFGTVREDTRLEMVKQEAGTRTAGTTGVGVGVELEQAHTRHADARNDDYCDRHR